MFLFMNIFNGFNFFIVLDDSIDIHKIWARYCTSQTSLHKFLYPPQNVPSKLHAFFHYLFFCWMIQLFYLVLNLGNSVFYMTNSVVESFHLAFYQIVDFFHFQVDFSLNFLQSISLLNLIFITWIVFCILLIHLLDFIQLLISDLLIYSSVYSLPVLIPLTL